MDKGTDDYKDNAASITLSDISRSLLRIERMLQKGRPYLVTEDAIEDFKKHITTNTGALRTLTISLGSSGRPFTGETLPS